MRRNAYAHPSVREFLFYPAAVGFEAEFAFSRPFLEAGLADAFAAPWCCHLSTYRSFFEDDNIVDKKPSSSPCP